MFKKNFNCWQYLPWIFLWTHAKFGPTGLCSLADYLGHTDRHRQVINYSIRHAQKKSTCRVRLAALFSSCRDVTSLSLQSLQLFAVLSRSWRQDVNVLCYRTMYFCQTYITYGHSFCTGHAEKPKTGISKSHCLYTMLLHCRLGVKNGNRLLLQKTLQISMEIYDGLMRLA